MLLSEPNFTVREGHLDLSMRVSERWGFPHGMGMMNGTYAYIGDEICGPVMIFLTVPPGIDIPQAPAHGHASDNWRISMQGELWMGRKCYQPGDFRFQEGWKPYGSDGLPTGPDGGWHCLVFADRRGTKVRPVSSGKDRFPLDDSAFAEWAHLPGDQLSDDPVDGPGPAGLASTAGRIRGGHINGSFRNSKDWPEVSNGMRMLAALAGDRTCGPVMTLLDAEPSSVVDEGRQINTEVARVVVDGSCTIGDRMYVAGDIHIQEAGVASHPVAAGPGGVKEFVLYGDRRALVGDAAPISEELAALVDRLSQELIVDAGT